MASRNAVKDVVSLTIAEHFHLYNDGCTGGLLVSSLYNDYAVVVVKELRMKIKPHLFIYSQLAHVTYHGLPRIPNAP